MTRLYRYIRKAKLNKNKKGFTLVELLVAVAVIAIMTPVLVQGFIYASKLNYRSRLQQKADAAANSVYEGIAGVKYEELEDYFSANNDWKILDKGGTNYTHYVYKYYDELEDCEVKVAVEEYSEAYIVPDLNFVGVESKYLTLAKEINSLDVVAASKIEQAIKSDETIKNAIVSDIITKIRTQYNVTLPTNEISTAKILIECGEIDPERISKQTTVEVGVSGNNFVADYTVAYRYPASKPKPSEDNEKFKVSYSYAHFLNGEWISVTNSSLTISSQFSTVVESDTKTIAAEKVNNNIVAQNLFIYYDPFSNMDWITIKSKDSLQHNVYLIEQSEHGDVLNLSTSDSSVNNFDFVSASKSSTGDYTQLTNGGKIIKLYSNNPTIANGIPDSIYESSEHEAKMYRVYVWVTYQSTVFAEVSGSFKAGGETIDKYRG